jgi:hypothetical protein
MFRPICQICLFIGRNDGEGVVHTPSRSLFFVFKTHFPDFENFIKFFKSSKLSAFMQLCGYSGIPDWFVQALSLFF